MARLILERLGRVVNGVEYPDIEAADERVALMLRDWPIAGEGVIKVLYGADSFVEVLPEAGGTLWLVHAYSEPYRAGRAYECDGRREAQKYAAAYGRIISNDLMRAEFVRVFGTKFGRENAHWRRLMRSNGSITETRMRAPVMRGPCDE